MRLEGKLVRWNDAKGIGFIESNQGGEPIFVHIKAFRAQGRRPGLGDAVSFECRNSILVPNPAWLEGGRSLRIRSRADPARQAAVGR